MLVEGHTSNNDIYILAWHMCFGETQDNYVEFLNVRVPPHPSIHPSIHTSTTPSMHPCIHLVPRVQFANCILASIVHTAVCTVLAGLQHLQFEKLASRQDRLARHPPEWRSLFWPAQRSGASDAHAWGPDSAQRSRPPQAELSPSCQSQIESGVQSHPSIRPPVHPSVQQFIHSLSIRQSLVHSSWLHPPMHPPTHACIHQPSTHPPTHASTIQRPAVEVYAHSRQEAMAIDVHLTEISNSLTMEDYDVNLRSLRKLNKDIAEWVENADPEFWVAAFFVHTQDAGMTTSNGISTPCSSPSIHPSIRPSVHPSVYPSVRPSVRPSPFVCVCCARGRAREFTAEAAGHSRHGATGYAQPRL